MSATKMTSAEVSNVAFEASNATCEKTALAVVARLPPPTTGATAVTARVVSELGEKFICRVYNISVPVGKASIGRYFRTATRMLLAPFWLLKMRLTGIRHLYLVPDHANGLYGNLFSVVAARLLGMRCFIHHHSFSYVDQYDWRMAMIDRLIGRGGTHISLCDAMTQQLRGQYRSQARFLRVGNFYMVNNSQLATNRKTADSTLRLGLLSNLCVEKGLNDAIKLLQVLKSRGHAAVLVLAGPCVNADAKSTLEKAQAELGDAIDYRGFVTGDAKMKFYQDINVFLFPTHWSAEAQPLVLLEALVTGCPVLTFARGGIEELLGGTGYAFPKDGDFTQCSLPILEQWIHSPTDLVNESERSVRRAQELLGNAASDLSKLVDALAN